MDSNKRLVKELKKTYKGFISFSLTSAFPAITLKWSITSIIFIAFQTMKIMDIEKKAAES